MRRQLTSMKRAKGFSLAAFLIGLGMMSLMDAWWPWFMLVLGISLALRQLLLRKFYEMTISLVIFSSVFAIEFWQFPWQVFGPVVLFTAALFILTREYVDAKLANEDQQEEDLNHEIEEETNK